MGRATPGGPIYTGSGDGRHHRQAGPVGKHSDDVEVDVKQCQGNGRRKWLAAMVGGLLLLAALVCGAGSQGEGAAGSVATGTEVSQRGVVSPPAGTSTPPQTDDGSSEGSSDSTGGESADTISPEPLASPPTPAADDGIPAPDPTPAPVPVTVLETVPVNPELGKYDAPIDMPIIPVAAAVLPSGKVMTWSAYIPDDFDRADRYVMSGGGTGKTQHAVWDPATGKVSASVVSQTNHDMFCPGIAQLANGDIHVTGGQNADKTSIYHLADGTWTEAETMHISRGYGSACLLSNGKVFVLGGSWSGPKDLEKDAEIYDPTVGTWTLLPGIQAAFILTNDIEGVYRADNYGWFFPWSDATVFHAGPSTTMHWFDTAGEGSALRAGTRPGGNSANGNAVMFDTGKILACGGSEAFAKPQFPSTTEASLITIGKANTQAQVKELSPMNLARAYANAVVLPDGKVLITGGAHRPKEFYDGDAQYQPEIWDPATEEFTLLDAKHKIARTYHSTGVLLPDARVFTGGGGLCGDCKVNHLDTEIFNPPYLFNADGTLAPRPTISVSAKTAAHGSTLTVAASEQLMMVSMVRMGSATHSTNNDQRRLELCGPASSPCGMSPVNVTISSDPGIALPGNWMFFGLNAAGTPSEAEVVLIGTAS